MSVSPDQILNLLVADTLAPSNFGAQLERLRDGLYRGDAPDPFRAREQAEAQMMEQAGILRALDAFKSVQEFRPKTPKGDSYKTLTKIQKHDPGHRKQGEIAVGVLSAYQKWGTKSEVRGLVAVYGYIRGVAPMLCQTTITDENDIDRVIQQFRDGTARRASDLAAQATADSILALQAFLSTKRGK